MTFRPRFLASTALRVTAIAALAVACSPGGSSGEDEQLEALAAQGRTLRAKLTGQVSPGPELRAEFDRLVADARAWQAKTDRPQVAIETVEESSTSALARDDSGGGSDDGCDSCKGYLLDGDRICFLDSEGECPVPDPESELDIGRVCVYSCISIASEATGAKQ